MPYARGHTVCLMGIDGHPVTVEVHIGNGKSQTVLTGMPDTALTASTVRIQSAFENCQLQWPDYHVVINLVPASLPKAGAVCDLAIAITLAAASGQVPDEHLTGLVLLGELGLDGSLRGIRGVLPALLSARRAGMTAAIVPASCVAEARLVSGLKVRGAHTLGEVVDFLRGNGELPEPDEPAAPRLPALPDLADVVGQDQARRALEIAAAGAHHILMVGPPGSGKTMLAERLPSILPPLTNDEALETTAVRSVAGTLETPTTALSRRPPFSAPHHSVTVPAMVGGGSNPLRPGAISMAHNGVLFLDECPEAKTDVLDSLRQPLESGEITIARAKAVARFPARIQLVLAANPCPCAAPRAINCRCPPTKRRRYMTRLSGPLLDRVDIRLETAPVSMAALLAAEQTPESSTQVAQRVAQARAAAHQRWSTAGYPWCHNSAVPGPTLRSPPWRLPRAVSAPADHLVDTGQLTARGYDRVLRLSWSMADLGGRQQPDHHDVREATELRLGHQIAGLPP